MTASMGLRHLWTPEDDDRLNAAVTALASADLRGNVKIWHAVAGRLAPELCVSPDAARSRYEKLQNQRAAERERIRIEAEKEAADRRAAEESAAKASTQKMTIDHWSAQWGDCPCGSMIPDATDATTVICRHCGRRWNWDRDTSGMVISNAYSWCPDPDTHALAAREEAWGRAAILFDQYEDSNDGAADNMLFELRDEIAALSSSLQLGLKAIQSDRIEIVAQIADLREQMRSLREMWK